MIDLYYCQKDQAYNAFEHFYGRYLQDISLRKLNVNEPAVGQIFLVLDLPSKNRQNNVDVLSEDIGDIIKKHSLKGNCLKSLRYNNFKQYVITYYFNF